MLSKIKKSTALHYLNSKGWRTNRKIIVIESDDWGGIRMPNSEIYNRSLEKKISLNYCPYNTYDTLANNKDFTELFSILTKFKDKKGNHPIITANTIMANPDFDKIAASNYKEYFYEPFTKTLESYYPNENVFAKWQEGIDKNIFFPQFHGREHLYVKRWMNFVSQKSDETFFAFQNKYFGISTNLTKENRGTFLAALDFEDRNEIEGQKLILKEGLQLFKETFGYNSKSFIAPNYTWHNTLEPYLKELGIETLQGGRAQREPIEGQGTIAKKHYMGRNTNSEQTILVRNVEFEPSLNKQIDWHNYVLNQIKNAFLWKQPAVISSHRLNYIGGLHESNRTQNLILLEVLLEEILKRYPDVEFMTSDKLGEIIKRGNIYE